MSKIIYLNDKQIDKLLNLLNKENKDLETLKLIDKLMNKEVKTNG